MLFLSSQAITLPKFVLESPVSTFEITWCWLCTGLFLITNHLLELSSSTQIVSPTFISLLISFVLAASKSATLTLVKYVTNPVAGSTSVVVPFSLQ